jgi:dTDP-4-amino-4,6-dideoxygalactose transaminase
VSASEINDWVLPSWTFSASAAGIVSGGGTPTFADIEPRSHWLDIPPGNSNIGVLTVAPFGLPVRPDLLVRDTPTIVDAAASLGMAQGALGGLSPHVMVVFSLHATKVMGIGEGGCVVFGSVERAQKFRAWSNFGFFASRESHSIGTNAKMSEFQAAIGHAVLDNWDREKSDWLASRERVRDISRTLGLNSLDSSEDFVSPYWIAEFADESERKSVELALSEAGIASRRWWLDGCHRMPAYRAVKHGNLVHTDRKVKVTLGLPFYRGLSETDQNQIVAAISAALS